MTPLALLVLITAAARARADGIHIADEIQAIEEMWTVEDGNATAVDTDDKHRGSARRELPEPAHQVEMVVCRFKEDVSWVPVLPARSLSFTIHNKGAPLDASGLGTATQVLNIANIGTEGYCFLRHIIDNYDSLANVTVFGQAGVSGHGGGQFFSRLLYVVDHGLRFGYGHLSMCGIIKELDGCPQLCELKGALPRAWQTIFGSAMADMDLPIWYATGAVVATTRDNIRFRPRAFYENILRMYDSDDQYGHGTQYGVRGMSSLRGLGYVLEALWGRILGGEMARKLGPDNPAQTGSCYPGDWTSDRMGRQEYNCKANAICVPNEQLA
jgi:hypothetical protein